MSCDAALQRGLLWHSWLKNQILKMDPDYVLRMKSRPSLQEERLAFEQWIQPGGEFESKLNDARQFAGVMVEGFSPAQLVDRGPLLKLSTNVREAVKSVIHREYLAQSLIEDCAGPMADAIDDLDKALKEFSGIWYRKPAAGHDLIRRGFEQLQVCAKALHERLGALPEGIVLL
jgi:hypothetical protein